MSRQIETDATRRLATQLIRLTEHGNDHVDVLRSPNGFIDAGFHRAKLATARFYFKRILPRAEAHLDAMSAGARSLMEIPADLL